jgi:hypothetical protein
MHKRVLAVLFLSAIALSVRDAHAQSCAALAEIKEIRAVSANCTAGDDGTIHCKPNAPVTFVADVRWSFSSAPHCPVEFRWSFGDGTPVVITTEPTVQHVFAPTSVANGVYPMTVHAAGTVHGASATIRAIWGTISVERLVQTAREGSIPGRVAISRTDTTTATTVGYSVSSFPSEYVTPQTTSVTFAAGESRKEIEIPITNDTVHRGSGRGDFAVTSATGGWRVAPERTTFAIEDDEDETHYRFTLDRVTGREGSTLTLDIARSGAIQNADMLTVKVGRPLEAAGTLRYQLPFAPNQTSGVILIELTDDDTWSPSFETYATCSSERAPWVGDQIAIIVTDDEPLPEIAQTIIEVTESDATQLALLPLTWRPRPTTPTALYTITSDGTARKEHDYEAISGYVAFPSSTFGVTIVGDDVPESDETFTIAFGDPFRDSLTVRIIDDDRPPFDFEFESPSYTFDEAGGTVGIRRIGSTSSAATVTLRLVGRTPASWTIPDVTIAFAAGETLKHATLATDDHWFTNGRQATLELEWNRFYGASAELTLRDDEAMPLLTLSDADALEGSAAEFVLSLSAPIGADLFLKVSTENGTASDGDYTPLAAQSVHIPSGVTSVKVPVATRGDDITEGTETFALKITSCCGGFAQLANAGATATIRESGAPPASASYRIQANDRVNEGADWLTATVTRRGDTSGRSVAIVKLTADAARQFTPVTLHFAPGETKKDVRFAIDDHFRSGDALALLEVFAGTRRDDKREVTIRDDEERSVLTIHDLTVSEPASEQQKQIAFVITIEPPSFAPIDIDLTTAAGTARADLDFIPVAGTRRIPSLATRFEVPVKLYGDSVEEPKETFTMTLRTWPQAGVTAAIGDGVATCSIVDSGQAGMQVGAYEPLIARGTTSIVTVDFPHGATNIGPLRLTSSDPGVVSVPESVTMTIGATSVAIPVTALRRGNAMISIALPIYYNTQAVEAPLSVYEVHAPVITPAAIAVEAGSVVRVKLSAAPLPEDDIRVTLALANGTIAMVENAVTIPRGGYATFDLAGATPGATELIVTFESAAGGTTLRVPLFVTNGQTRRRGARH